MKKYLFWATLSFFVGFAKAQVSQEHYDNYLPKDPETFSFGKVGNIPIDYYTGLPNVSIPLGTITSQRISLPISLSYDASGVRVSEVAGEVGLKWNLQAGGSITRVMNGKPDEMPTIGYLDVIEETNNFTGIDNKVWATNYEEKTKDTEPDEFLVNINGRSSIKLFFDSTGKLVSMPKMNIKVEAHFILDKIEGFTITYPDGFRYSFGQGAGIESTKISNLNYRYSGPSNEESVEEKFTTDDFYFSKWHLTKIKEPLGDYIQFEYEQQATINYVGYPEYVKMDPVKMKCDERVNLFDPPNWKVYLAKFGKTPPNYLDLYFNGEVSYGGDCFEWAFTNEQMPPLSGAKYQYQALIQEKKKYLTAIRAGNGGSVTLGLSGSREDIPNALKVTNISFRNSSNELYKKVSLNYSTISSNARSGAMSDPLTELEDFMQKKFLNPATSYVNARQLSSTSESSITHTLFKKYVYEGVKDYNYKRLFLSSIKVSGGTEMSVLSDDYSFTYKNPSGLPRRLTSRNTYGLFKDGISNGTLVKINYPTGGYTEFSYKANTLGHKLILVQDKLPDGSTASQRKIEHDSPIGYRHESTVAYQNYLLPGTEDWYKYKINYSTPQGGVHLTHGVPEGSTKVRVYYEDANGVSNGYEELEFSSPNGVSGGAVHCDPMEVNGFGEEVDVWLERPQIFPFPSSLVNDYSSGLLKSRIVKNAAGAIIEEMTNVYTFNPNNYQPATAKRFIGGRIPYTFKDGRDFWDKLWGRDNQDAVYKYRWSTTELSSDWLARTSTTVKNYNLDGSKFLTTETTYEEHPTYPGLIKSQTINNPDGSVTKTEFTYPVDFFNPETTSGLYNPTPEVLAIYQLTRQYELNVPLESITYYKAPGAAGFNVVSATQIVYKKHDHLGKAVPFRLYKLNIKEGTTSIDKLSMVIQPNVPVHMKRDANYQLINEFNYDDNGNLLESKPLDGVNKTLEWGYNNSLVSGSIINPGANEHKTQYTYRPSVGMTKQTDANGRSVSYEYDHNNRLLLIKDGDQNITQRFRYHNMTNGPGGYAIALVKPSLSSMPTYPTGVPVEFEVTKSPPLGETLYYWDFGDGTIVSGTSGKASHFYDDPGNYKIKVVAVNPEFPNSVCTANITIVP